MARRVLLMLSLTIQLLTLASPRDSPLGLLLPRPARVAVRTGEADVAALARITEMMADVGAPAGKPAEESYRLDISANGVRLTAPTAKGLRYGRVTLRQLQALCAPGPVPACEIVDWPAAARRLESLWGHG